MVVQVATRIISILAEGLQLLALVVVGSSVLLVLHKVVLQAISLVAVVSGSWAVLARVRNLSLILAVVMRLLSLVGLSMECLLLVLVVSRLVKGRVEVSWIVGWVEVILLSLGLGLWLWLPRFSLGLLGPANLFVVLVKEVKPQVRLILKVGFTELGNLVRVKIV